MFLSGCHFKDSFRYAFLISAAVADFVSPRTLYGLAELKSGSGILSSFCFLAGGAEEEEEEEAMVELLTRPKIKNYN